MNIEKLGSKTKNQLLELAKKQRVKVKSSMSKTELLARLKEIYEKKERSRPEKRIRKPATRKVEVEEKLPEKEVKVERGVPTEKAVYSQKIQERLITKEKDST
jgi:hypothetical protein